MMRDLTEEDLNPAILQHKPEWAKGVLAAANLANEMYASSNTHPYLIGDCLLGKLNLLKSGRKPRRNTMRA